jgi:hypothetical protein
MTSLLNNTRRPDITFNRNGRVDISARIAHLLSLCSGDVIDIAVHDNEYYIYVKYCGGNIVGRHEGQCYSTTRSGHGTFRTWSVQLCKAIHNANGGNTAALRLPCGMPVIFNGKTYIPIIIHNAL